MIYNKDDPWKDLKDCIFDYAESPQNFTFPRPTDPDDTSLSLKRLIKKDPVTKKDVWYFQDLYQWYWIGGSNKHPDTIKWIDPDILLMFAEVTKWRKRKKKCPKKWDFQVFDEPFQPKHFAHREMKPVFQIHVDLWSGPGCKKLRKCAHDRCYSKVEVSHEFDKAGNCVMIAAKELMNKCE